MLLKIVLGILVRFLNIPLNEFISCELIHTMYKSSHQPCVNLFSTAEYNDVSSQQSQDTTDIQEESDDSGSENKLEEPVTPTSPGKLLKFSQDVVLSQQFWKKVLSFDVKFDSYI